MRNQKAVTFDELNRHLDAILSDQKGLNYCRLFMPEREDTRSSEYRCCAFSAE